MMKKILGGRFVASAVIDGKSLYLGTYINETDAARAYDKCIIDNNLGDYANLNFRGGTPFL